MLSIGKKQYIILFGFIVLFFILVFIALIPLFSAIQKNSAEVIDQKKQVALSQSKMQNFNILAAEYKESQSNIDKISSLYIDPKEPLGFINFLETTASKLGLSIDIFVNNNSKPDQNSLEFQITTSGSFSNLMKFLEKLESANYLADINSLNIQKIQEEKLDSHGKPIKADSIQIKLNVNVFYQP